MKFSVSLVALALTATQVMAVIPEPIKGCTKSVIVSVINDTCVDFASRHGTTFDNMLLWNNKLRKDCLNLDHGHPICVSITKGDCCLDMNEPTGTTSAAPPPVGTSAATLPATSAAATSAAPTAPGASGTSAAPKSTGASASSTLPPASVQTNEAVGVKGSMMIAAVGVMLSVAYVL